MTAVRRILGSVWRALIWIVMMVACGITWACRVWSTANALLDPRGASFIGVLFLSAPGIALLALARWIDRRHYERRR